MAGYRVALLAWRYPRLSQLVLDHVLTECPEPLPKGGRHAAARKRREPRLLRTRGLAGAVARWWRDANAEDPAAGLPELKPITGPTAVSFPRLPVAGVTGAPPWQAAPR